MIQAKEVSWSAALAAEARRRVEACPVRPSPASSPDEIERFLFALNAIGDVLRAGAELTDGVRRWLLGLDASSVDALGARAAAQAPRPGEVPAGGDLVLPLVRRDRFESVRVAVRRALFAHRVFPGAAPGLDALDLALSRYDDGLRARVSCADVQRALGWRAALGPAWADGFKPSDTAGGAVGGGPPSDAAVVEFLVHGTSSLEIESAASEQVEFAEELASLITSAIGDRAEVSLVARRWLRTQQPAMPGVFDLGVLHAKRLAAADVTSEALPAEAVRWVQLGVLSPLDAEASLRVTADELVLCVYPGERRVLSVRANEVAVHEATADGHWEVALAIGRYGHAFELGVCITGADGVEFSERLELTPENDGEDPHAKLGV